MTGGWKSCFYKVNHYLLSEILGCWLLKAGSWLGVANPVMDVSAVSATTPVVFIPLNPFALRLWRRRTVHSTTTSRLTTGCWDWWPEIYKLWNEQPNSRWNVKWMGWFVRGEMAWDLFCPNLDWSEGSTRSLRSCDVPYAFEKECDEPFTEIGS